MVNTSSPLAPLSIPTFRSVWVWIPFSNLGSVVQAVGAAWLMTSITNSADLVALVQTSTTLPILLFSLAAGAISDNFDRRTVMLVAQVFMFATSAVLAVLAFLGLITPWLLLLFTFLVGCGTALNNPAWQSSVGDLVPRSHLAAAILLNSVTFNITRGVGPALGGIIVAAAGAAAAFAFNAVSYLGLIVRLLKLPPFKTGSDLPPETLGPAMGVGLRYVLMSPNIEAVLARGFAFGFAFISVQALLPLVAKQTLGGGPLVYGILLGAFGLGGMIAGLNGHRLRERMSSEWLIRCTQGAGALCLLLLSMAGGVWTAGLALVIGGASQVLTFSFCNIVVQSLTPRWVVGRALASYQTATFGGMALGGWVWGIVAERYGLAVGLEAAAATTLAGVAIGFWLRMPDLTPRNLDPIDRRLEPHIAIDLERRSGPVVIMIEYLIAERNEVEFLAAMRERRLIRGRNGARSWSLMRDVENARVWIESYHVANWIEYLRHHQRTTNADAEVTETIRALHEGDQPPKVHRLVVRPTWKRPAALEGPGAGPH